MRNLILLLLALNAFYLVWSMVFNDKYTEPPRTVEGIPELVLLPSQAVQKKSKYNCYTLGPFNIKKTAELVSNEINNAGYSSNIHPQQTMETLSFLVYLQALPSREEADKIVKKLVENEAKEYTIIDAGPYKNAIALGSFDNLDKARRHSEYIRFMGFDSKYTEQRKPKEVYWIDYDELVGNSLPVMQWVNKTDSNASVQQVVRGCEL